MTLVFFVEVTMAETISPSNIERRKRVFLGSLPDDFLRICATDQQQQVAADQQTALALQQQLVGTSYAQNTVGRLNITVAQAKLVKNYGMTRMDPYARIRVGHCVYETHTDPNGGKNPRWNKVIQCLLPQGVNSIYLEIYDECSFTMDELIAWTHINIPQLVFNGETHENWYPLNGKQGEGVEGMVNLVLSYTGAPMLMVPNLGNTRGHTPVTVYSAPPGIVSAGVSPQSQSPQPAVTLSEEELKQIQEMFPNVDKEAIKSVCEANRGNKDATVNSLLQMCE